MAVESEKINLPSLSFWHYVLLGLVVAILVARVDDSTKSRLVDHQSTSAQPLPLILLPLPFLSASIIDYFQESMDLGVPSLHYVESICDPSPINRGGGCGLSVLTTLK
jgi:hypothetical protein